MLRVIIGYHLFFYFFIFFFFLFLFLSRNDFGLALFQAVLFCTRILYWVLQRLAQNSALHCILYSLSDVRMHILDFASNTDTVCNTHVQNI